MKQSSNIDLNSILSVITRSTSNTDIIRYVIKNIRSEISTTSKNSLYWTNQISWMKENGGKAEEIKQYRTMLKNNNKEIKRHKRSIKLLKKLIKLQH